MKYLLKMVILVLVCFAWSMPVMAQTPDVLLLSEDSSAAAGFAELLEASGLHCTQTTPQRLVDRNTPASELLVCLKDCSPGEWVEELAERGRRSRVLVVGVNGARILGKMDLLIGDGHACHGAEAPVEVFVPNNVLTGPLADVFQTPYDFTYAGHREIAIQLHAGSGKLHWVTIYDGGEFPRGTQGIGRQFDSLHHWVCAKQGNYALWGADSDAETLTEEGRALFVNLCHYLANAKSEPLLFPDKVYVSEGLYTGILVGGHRVKRYFVPREAGTVTFHLEWAGTNTMMLWVREPFQREDGCSPLELEVEIASEDIGVEKKLAIHSFSLPEGEQIRYELSVTRQRTPARNHPSFWEESYSVALEKAQDENRNLFVMLTATWCSFCREIETNTLSDRRVREALSSFVPVQVFEDKDIEKKLGCDGYPTLVFMDANENVAHRFSGFKDVESFLKEVDQAKKALGMRRTR